jgi:conjugal transfer pilus assembly protein TraU
MKVPSISSTCHAISATIALIGCVASTYADDLRKGKFPNLTNDICWSRTFPIKMFGSTSFISNSQEEAAPASWYSSGCAARLRCKAIPQKLRWPA